MAATNTTGAGDAFMAGLIYGIHQQLGLLACTKMGMAAASIAIQHKDAVNPNMNSTFLQDIFENHPFYE